MLGHVLYQPSSSPNELYSPVAEIRPSSNHNKVTKVMIREGA